MIDFFVCSSKGSLKEAPQIHARQSSALVILYVPLQLTVSNRNCKKGPKKRTPTLPPTETTPTARDWHLRKFFAVMRNEDVNMKDAPNPYIKLKVKNIQIRLHEYEVNNKPTVHVRPPAMAVKRHPIVLQRIDPKGQRKNVKAIVRDPSQTVFCLLSLNSFISSGSNTPKLTLNPS